MIAVNRDNDPGLAEQTGDGSEYVADLHDMACSDPRHRPIGGNGSAARRGCSRCG